MRVLPLLSLAMLRPALLHAADPVTVEITDKVLVPAAERLGVHFFGHNYYDSVIVKQRAAENFDNDPGTLEP